MTMDTVTGVVLAGGRSRRFGQDKGRYPFRGKPLAEHALEIISPHCSELLICSNSVNAYKHFGVPVIEDIHKNCGPIGGIHSALKHAAGQTVVCVPCDCPFIPAEMIGYLLQRSEDHQVVMPHHRSFIETLCAVWQKNSYPHLEKAINEKRYRILDAIQTMTVLLVNPENEPFYHNRVFHNINRKTDL